MIHSKLSLKKSYKMNFVKIKKIQVFNKGPGYLGTYGFSIKLFLWLLRNRSKYIAFTVHGLWRFNLLAARILLKNKYFKI